MKYRSFALFASMALSVAACDVQSVVDDLNDQAVQAAFDTVEASAEASGGAAELVSAGQETTLTVNNPNSPINGATVVVPAGALGSDVDKAVVAVLGYTTPVSPEDPVFNGPAALVQLKKLPGLEDIVPLAPLVVGLPYAADNSYPVDQLTMGMLDTTNGGAADVEGSKGDEAKKQVVGDVTDLTKPLLAVWGVQYDGGAAYPGTFIYKVTKGDGTTCKGLFRGDGIISSGIRMAAGGAGWEYNAVLGNAAQATLFKAGTADMATPETAPVTLALDAAGTSVTCLGGTYAADGATVTALEVVYSNWEEPAALPSAQTCTLWGGPYCYTHNGDVDLVATLDYVTAAGDHVQAAADVRARGVLWLNTDDGK